MARLPKQKFVKFVRSKGNVYGYFNTGKRTLAGKPIYAPMGKASALGFQDTYNAMMGHRTRNGGKPITIAELADKYEGSPEFAKKARGTRLFYTSILKHVRSHLGKFPISALKRSHVVEIVENRLNAQPGTRNGFLAVVGVLYKYGRQMELTDLKPAADIEKFTTGTHEPWPEDILAAGLAAEHDRTRLAIALLYYTGQRIGDAVRFRWDDIRDGFLYFTQQKTGKAMQVALHSSLKDELARTERRGETILSTYEGEPMTDQVIRREIKAFASELGLVPHGLRKNAVNALLEAGCTTQEVMAITGQTSRIVDRYALRVNQKKMGRAAMNKLENVSGKFNRV